MIPSTPIAALEAARKLIPGRAARFVFASERDAQVFIRRLYRARERDRRANVDPETWGESAWDALRIALRPEIAGGTERNVVLIGRPDETPPAGPREIDVTNWE